MADPVVPKITQLTEAVKNAINAAAIEHCPAAERVQETRFELAKDTAQVDVVAGEDREYTRLSRGGWTDAPSVDVFVYRKVKASFAASNAGDQIAGVCEQIVDLFKEGRIAGFRLIQPTPQSFERDWCIQFGIVGYVINLKFSDP